MCENASWQSILTIFATLDKRKGVNQLCCTSRYRQTPVSIQQRSPHPEKYKHPTCLYCAHMSRCKDRE